MTTVIARPWFTIVWTWLCGGITLVMIFMAVAQWTGLDPARDDEAALGGVMIAVMTGAMTVAGAFLSRRPKQLSLSGIAGEEESLAGLLHQLSYEPGLPAGLLDRVWHTASVAAGRFRLVAARIDVLEAAVRRVPPGERAAIEYEIGTLAARLDEVFAAYQALVPAAARASLATPPDVGELTEATQHLAGLTEGLHDVATLG